MMNKKRYILFFWIGIGIILLLNILIWVYLNQVESRFSTELKTRLIGNNRSLSRLIDPETLALLVPGQHNSQSIFPLYSPTTVSGSRIVCNPFC